VIGRVLDKYEILEEVGQGGMAVVYRGRDRVLQREVAVKVLHPHLASAEEARRRFEREAHAVAKLRHENILEIFDYSGNESADAYIVTEFINGRTLKSMLTSHAPAFPEIGAMIVVEVLRALQHAHGLGVLHRDVKPENVMIRDDGVIKLMDFGIAQIVDAQRMTVTGQLLGSPAYMSPEHIEGRPLDFRTDVFAAGILLYQLTAHELPFKGKNPHEILKRIADCRFTDARAVNPRIGDRLNRIIARALAREPDDRYPEVGAMLAELLRFLAEVDLTDPRGELKPFFADPVVYEAALRQRLLLALLKNAKAELAGRRTPAALELMNRVLTVDPGNEEVLRLLDRVERRRLLRRMAAVGAGVVALGGVGAWYLMHPAPLRSEPVTSVQMEPDRAVVPAPALVVAPVVEETKPSPPPAPRKADPPVARGVAPEPPRPPPRPRAHADGEGSAVPEKREFTLMPKPFNAEYSVDGGEFKKVPLDSAKLILGPGPHTIEVRHELCVSEQVSISANEAGDRQIPVRLQFKSANLTVNCPGAQSIAVDKRSAESGATLPITDFRGSRKQVEVVFSVDGRLQTKRVDVVPGSMRDVTCD
jgi:eukaryotic-like serine/threonine-protein kinase